MGIQLKKDNGDLISPLVNSSDITWNSDINMPSNSFTGESIFTNFANVKKIMRATSIEALETTGFPLILTEQYTYNVLGTDPKNTEEFFKEAIKALASDIALKSQPTSTMAIGVWQPNANYFIIGFINDATDTKGGLPRYSGFIAFTYHGYNLRSFGTADYQYMYMER